jgi:hypothetical protein
MSEQEEIEALGVFEAIVATRAVIARRRSIVGGLTLLVLGLYGMLFYSLFTNFDGDLFSTAVAEGIGRRVPAIGRQFTESSSTLLPAYSETLADQAEPRMLSLNNRLEKEMGLLVGAVSEIGEKRSTHTLAVAAERIDSALSAEYPELAQDDAARQRLSKGILAAFEAGGGAVITRHANAPGRELERLINATVVTAVAANKVSNPLNSPAELRMVISMLGVVSRELVAQKARLMEDSK